MFPNDQIDKQSWLVRGSNLFSRKPLPETKMTTQSPGFSVFNASQPMSYKALVCWLKKKKGFWNLASFDMFTWKLFYKPVLAKITTLYIVKNKWINGSIGCMAMSVTWTTLIAKFMGPTWGPSGADRTQVGPMLAPWTLLSGNIRHLR